MNRFPIFLVLLFAFCVRAEDIYVAQTAQGSDTGVNAANAHSLAWLNTSGNWGSGADKVSAGDTVHLCGTLTSTLTAQGSGTLGSQITIVFESGAKFQAARFYPAISVANRDYLTIDGGSNGLIENTNNGTTLGEQDNSTGIECTGTRGLIIRNITITNLYQRTPYSTTDGNRFGVGISGGGSDALILSNRLSGGDTMLGWFYDNTPTSNVVMQANTILDCNHGITVGANSSVPILYNLQIISNRIDDLDLWNGHAGLHLDGMIIFNESPGYEGTISNLVIAANEIGPDIGTITTAGIFLNTYKPHQINRALIYNNLFRARSPYTWNNGNIGAGPITNSVIANNTFIGYDGVAGIGIGISTSPLGGEAAALGTSVVLTNNVFYSIGTPISLGACAAIPSQFKSDHNAFWDYYSGSGSFFGPGYAAANYTWWQSQGFDAASTTTQPSLDGNYVPTAGDTVAKDQGVSVSQYFTVDKLGTSRSGSWDKGAFEYTSGGAPSPPDAPTIGTATANSYSTVTLTWTDNADDENGFTAAWSYAGQNDWNEILGIAANAESYQFFGLASYRYYEFRVKAVNAAGSSAWSGTASAQTPARIIHNATNLRKF